MNVIDAVKDVEVEDRFFVQDSNGDPVENLVNVDFTKELSDETGAEVSGDITITVTELDSKGGQYKTNFTPDENGDWSAKVVHPIHQPDGFKSQYRVRSSEFSIHTVKELWDYAVTSITTAGSIGKRIVDYLNDAITSRAPVNEYDAELASISADTTITRLATTGQLIIDTDANTITIYDDAGDPFIVSDLKNAEGDPASGDATLLNYSFRRIPQ